MTEQEWLASDDPAAMLAWVTTDDPNGYCKTPRPRPSDRKLRLFACACWRLNTDRDLYYSREQYEAIEREDGMSGGDAATLAGAWARASLGDRPDPSQAEKAALLRDIVGSPFRSFCWCGNTKIGDPHKCGMRGRIVTPTVLSLAQAAYSERLDDGTLDPFRLAVLADALEEAGAVGELCPYCKDADFGVGDLGTPMMGGKEPYASRAKSYFNSHCACKGERRLPHPLLAHLRSPGPHYRGMWSLDIVLGRG